MFSSISRLFLRWRGPKSIAKLDGAIAGFGLPWIRHCQCIHTYTDAYTYTCRYMTVIPIPNRIQNTVRLIYTTQRQVNGASGIKFLCCSLFTDHERTCIFIIQPQRLCF